MRAVVLLVFAVLSCATADDRPDERAVQAMTELERRGFAGSVLVACGARIVFQDDYGVTPPAGRAPSYWLASISKQFTAVAILQLAQAGRIELADPLSRFFPDAPADKASITLLQLLSHRSGLPQAYAADGVGDRSAAARAVFATPLRDAPGGAFRYSNDNYTLLAMVVEIVSGERFEDYVRAHELAPAGLTDTGFWPDAGDAYVPPLLAPLTGASALANWGFRGGHGMRASVQDLHRWVMALDGGRVLSQQSVAMLYGPHAQAGDGDGVGFGWFWSEEDGVRWLWTRGSDTSGSNAILYRLWGSPLVVVAATNAGPAESDGPGWSRQARDALMEVFGEETCR
jgi:CubicO group peptidase (beta-lactamase class C family)